MKLYLLAHLWRYAVVYRSCLVTRNNICSSCLGKCSNTLERVTSSYLQLDNDLYASLHWALWSINTPSFSRHHKSVSLLQTYHNDKAAIHALLVVGKKRISFMAHDLMQGQLMLLHFPSIPNSSPSSATDLAQGHRDYAWLHAAPRAYLVADTK